MIVWNSFVTCTSFAKTCLNYARAWQRTMVVVSGPTADRSTYQPFRVGWNSISDRRQMKSRTFKKRKPICKRESRRLMRVIETVGTSRDLGEVLLLSSQNSVAFSDPPPFHQHVWPSTSCKAPHRHPLNGTRYHNGTSILLLYPSTVYCYRHQLTDIGTGVGSHWDWERLWKTHHS